MKLPLMLDQSGFSSVVCRELHLEAKEARLEDWKKMVEQIKNRTREVHIGLVGKYVKLHDAYLSVVEALNHAGYAQNAYIRIHWIDSENITKENVAQIFRGIHGIIVPAFWNRGIEGMTLQLNMPEESDSLFRDLSWHAGCRP